MPAAVDWIAIEAEYVTGQVSCAALAEKYGVSPYTLGKRARANGWRQKRQEYRNKVGRKMVEKSAEQKGAKLAALQDIADRLTEKTLKLLEDEMAFNRHLIPEGMGKGVYTTNEKIYDKFDTRALRDVAASLKDLTSSVRNLYGLPTAQEEAALQIARDRLELDRIKAAAGQSASQDGTGVIFLPDAGDDGDGN